MKKLIFLALLLACSGNAHADFNGKVIKVADGDTVTVLKGKQQMRVRLASIDAPEKNQPYGTRSRQHLSDLVFGKTLRVEEQGRDRYGRTIGVLHLQGADINRAMVSAGMAWAYTDYLNDRLMPLYELRARMARRGLWADNDPMAPWQFRREQAAERRQKRNQG